MAKAKETRAVVTALRDEVKAGLAKHVGELTGHMVDSAQHGGHGHLQGKQGPKGHDMPNNESHLQGDAHIPRGAISRLPQNAQNTWTERAGFAEDGRPEH
jgi:hypothetical protein